MPLFHIRQRQEVCDDQRQVSGKGANSLETDGLRGVLPGRQTVRDARHSTEPRGNGYAGQRFRFSGLEKLAPKN